MARRPRSLVATSRIRVRYAIRRLDRDTPAWLSWLTPWATSLVLHSAALLALAFLVYANSESPSGKTSLQSTFTPADQLTDDLTSLNPSDHAGDSFTTLTTIDPPSFSTDPVESGPIATPDSLLAIGPGNGITVPDIARKPQSADAAKGPGISIPEPSVPFTGRQGEAKARLVRREGGTIESEKAVDSGVDWLARHQKKDGSWSLSHRSQCKGAGCSEGATGQSEVAATGLALLPMLGAGHSHVTPGRYQDTIRKGIDWLLSVQQSTGEIFTGGGGNTRMYSHAIATMTLCEAYGISREARLKGPAEKAVSFIIQSQSPDDGGWRYNPGDPGDTSVFGWQMLALRSAQLAGLKVSPEVFQSASKYLDRAAVDAKKTAYAYQPGGQNSPIMSAEALLVRQYLGWPRESSDLSKGVKNVSTHLLKDQDRNIYYWYYATQLLHNMQNLAWKEWNPRVRNGLVAMQTQGAGCDRGSWDPARPVPDHWGVQMGRHYTTAMSILTLEVYYRYLPLYKARDRALPGTSVGSP